MRITTFGAGEVIADTERRTVELLCDRDGLHLTRTRFAPGEAGAGLHVHHTHEDLFYVLAGELSLPAGTDDEVLTATPGELVRIPTEVAHGFRNDAGVPLEHLNLHIPGAGFNDYLRGLRDGVDVSWFDQVAPPPAGAAGSEHVAVTSAPDGGRGRTVLAQARGYVVAETTGEPGPDPVTALVVLAGEATVRFGEKTVTAAPRTVIEPGAPARYGVDGRARILEIILR